MAKQFPCCERFVVADFNRRRISLQKKHKASTRTEVRYYKPDGETFFLLRKVRSSRF